MWKSFRYRHLEPKKFLLIDYYFIEKTVNVVGEFNFALLDDEVAVLVLGKSSETYQKQAMIVGFDGKN